MSVHTGAALFRFYFDGRSHTLKCRRCVTQIFASSPAGSGKDHWSAIGVFEGGDGSSNPLRIFQSAFAAEPMLEGVFGIEAEEGTTITGWVTVTDSRLSDAGGLEGLRLILTGNNSPAQSRSALNTA